MFSRFALLLVCCLAAGHGVAATFFVSNGNDSGAGSLRAAINAANAEPSTVASPHSISIGSSVNTIRVFTPLPVISRPLVIDGSKNSSATTSVDVLYDSATNSPGGRLLDANAWVRVQNLNLGNYSQSQNGSLGTGLHLRSTAAGSQVRGVQARDFVTGLNVLADNVLVTEQLVQSGWTHRGRYTRNTYGIYVSDVSGFTLRGTTLGGAEGTLDTSNLLDGLMLLRVGNATIGMGDRGSSAGRVIAIENGRDGIVATDSPDLVVSGAWIGVDPADPAANRGNGWNNPGNSAGIGVGLKLGGVRNAWIGGFELAQGNVIGHNRSSGLAIGNSEGVKVFQNRIGVNPDDSVAGNRYDGVLVSGSLSPFGAIEIGELLSAGNRIQNNGQLFEGFTSNGVTILSDARNVWVGNNAISNNGADAIGGTGATGKPRPVAYLADSSNQRIRLWFPPGAFPQGAPPGFAVIWADEEDEARLYRATALLTSGAQDLTLSLVAGTFPAADIGRNLRVSLLRLTGDPAIDGSSSLTVPVTIGPPRVLSLAPTAAPGATGSIRATPSGINCATGTTCTRSFSAGVPITLTATPGAGSRFAGWLSPDCPVGTVTTCTFTMPATTASFTPVFTRSQHSFSVTRTGEGTVTSSPGGINCGSTCSASFNYGVNVTLTATPAVGWTFAGWSGACTGTDPVCTRAMTSDRSTTATFTQSQPQFTLTVNRNGQGSVSSSPAGIACGATCSASFASGTSVTLTPTPVAGWQFSSWSGACIGSGACTVSMTQARSVTATFTELPPSTFSLQVNTEGEGGVVSSPAGIACGATCSAAFASGTQVTLTPTPAAGWLFSGWSGACTGSGACTVTMNQNRNVTARFGERPIFANGFEALP